MGNSISRQPEKLQGCEVDVAVEHMLNVLNVETNVTTEGYVLVKKNKKKR